MWNVIGRNSIVKNAKVFFLKKILLKIPFRYREIVKINENISLIYDVNGHVYLSQNLYKFVRI